MQDNPNIQAVSGGMQCSCFLAWNEKGEPLFCRNLDYALANHPIVMVGTSAPRKNAGLGICDLYYLGYSKDKLPSGSLFSDRALLSAPRITIDGMNEYGVAVAMLSVPHAEPTLDPAKQSIDEAAAARLIMDHAKTVEEAVEVLKGYNMAFHDGASHFMIADGKGDSAVVEFVGGEITVIKSDNPWQVVTNFILSDKNREGVGQYRYDLAELTLEKSRGILSEEEAMKLLLSISQPGTLWSVIYNLKTGEARLALSMKYDQLYTFHLKMQP
jgi:penicillin V acylase-like amidase (Ntn superfamily)